MRTILMQQLKTVVFFCCCCCCLFFHFAVVRLFLLHRPTVPLVYTGKLQRDTCEVMEVWLLITKCLLFHFHYHQPSLKINPSNEQARKFTLDQHALEPLDQLREQHNLLSSYAKLCSSVTDFSSPILASPPCVLLVLSPGFFMMEIALKKQSMPTTAK